MQTPPPTTRHRRLTRLLPGLSLVFLVVALLPGCAKDGMVVSQTAVPLANMTPAIIPPIHPILPTQPFQAFLNTYNIPVTTNNTALGLGIGAFGGTNPNTWDNAEIGFAFRSSVAGNIIALGIFVPATGFAHTVTLWDSATQKILATAIVTETKVVLTYTSLTTNVPILANHAYVVGFNSMAIGSALDTYSVGNDFYAVDGFIVDGGLGADGIMLPFREGDITVENAFAYNYGDGKAPASLFPTTASWNTQWNFFGVCDISFAVPI